MFCHSPVVLQNLEAIQKLHTTPTPPSDIPAGAKDTNNGPCPTGGGGYAHHGKIAGNEFTGHEHEDPAADKPRRGNKGTGGGRRPRGGVTPTNMAEPVSSSGNNRNRSIANYPHIGNLLQKSGCNECGRPRRKGVAW